MIEACCDGWNEKGYDSPKVVCRCAFHDDHELMTLARAVSAQRLTRRPSYLAIYGDLSSRFYARYTLYDRYMYFPCHAYITIQAIAESARTKHVMRISARTCVKICFAITELSEQLLLWAATAVTFS